MPRVLAVLSWILVSANAGFALSPSTRTDSGEIRTPVDLAAAADFVSDFDAGPCAYLRRPFASERSVRIDAFGAHLAPFTMLDAAFKGRFNAEADIFLALISPDQCPLLEAAVHLGWVKLPEVLVSISQDAVDPDASVRVSFLGNRVPALFVLHRSGRVTYTSPEFDALTGTLRLTLPPGASPRERPLMIAISSEDVGLRDTLAKLAYGPDGASAADFSRAMQEGLATGSLHPIQLARNP